MPGKRISSLLRGQVYQLHLLGWGYKAIAQHFSLSQSTVRNIVKSPHTPLKPKGRSPVCCTPLRKRLVLRVTENGENRRKPHDEIGLLEGVDLNSRTVTKALAKEGLHIRITRRKPPSSVKIRAQRLEWARAHAHFTCKDWKHVIWTDESSIHPEMFKAIRVTRRAGEEFHIDCVRENMRPQFSSMIWGAMSAYGTLEYHIFEKGSINSQRYCEEVLPKLHKARCKQFTFSQQEPIIMQDNAPIHRSRETNSHLKCYGFTFMDWPPYSPDLNPIENLWAILKRKISQGSKITSLAMLKQRIEEE